MTAAQPTAVIDKNMTVPSGRPARDSPSRARPTAAMSASQTFWNLRYSEIRLPNMSFSPYCPDLLLRALLRDLRALALLLRPQLGRELGAEIFRLEDLADLDLGVLEGSALEPLDRLFLRPRLEPLAREDHAGLHQLVVELSHLGEDLLVRKDPGLGVLVGLHQHHESHSNVSFYLYDERRAGRSTRYHPRAVSMDRYMSPGFAESAQE